MVKFWEELLVLSIKKQKIRVKFCEQHGIGDTAIKEKFNLKKMERLLELRKQ